MNLKELTWPVRVYWDLPEGPPDPLDQKICEEILAIKILFLSLHDSVSPLSPACRDILNRLNGKNIAISLTIPGPAPAPSETALLSGSNTKALLLHASTLREVRKLGEKIGQFRDGGRLPGISFAIGKGNYRDIPDVVVFCLNNGIRDLAFPIQRLKEDKDIFDIGSEDRKEIALRLSGIDHGKLRITIHDPFLWPVFYPDADYHEGGCQAGNSMLYISSEYKVYPCPAMPVELGDLRETTLREIILSAKKKELRGSLLNPPAECTACGQVSKCFGGCRGRAFASIGSFSRRDPACKEPISGEQDAA